MRVVIGKEPLRRILRWTRRALFACGILLLGYFGFALADAWIFQGRESRALDRQLRERPAASASPSLPAPKSPRRARSAAIDGLVGRMEIPRLRLSAVVVEGVGPAALRRAVGHIPGTALPGGDGNVGIAGHRDTFFRPLKDLRVNDEIRFSTLRGNFKYEVESLTVVEPDNVGVLAPSHENVLTMVTCYPFSYIGAAPKRFIVRARQVWPRVLNRFGDSDGKKPLPGGRGSVNRAESTRLLPSRDRQGAVSPERLSTRPQAAPSTVAAVE